MIKQSLQGVGICADASRLILAAWRPGTNAVYNSAWKKWHSWCLARESDSFRPALADITSFLSDCFNEGLDLEHVSFRSVRHSSANGRLSRRATSFGCSFAKSRAESSTRFASLSAFLECGHIVLNYLRTLPGSKELSLKLLPQKVAVLLALTAPKRSSELQLLDLRFMRILPEGLEFKLPGLTKTSREVTSVFLTFAFFAVCSAILDVLVLLDQFCTPTPPARSSLVTIDPIARSNRVRFLDGLN